MQLCVLSNGHLATDAQWFFIVATTAALLLLLLSVGEDEASGASEPWLITAPSRISRAIASGGERGISQGRAEMGPDELDTHAASLLHEAKMSSWMWRLKEWTRTCSARRQAGRMPPGHLQAKALPLGKDPRKASCPEGSLGRRYLTDQQKVDQRSGSVGGSFCGRASDIPRRDLGPGAGAHTI